MRRTLSSVIAVTAVVAATGAYAEDTVKIGVNAALTGTFVSAGNTVHNAVKLAVKQINDAGGFVVNGKTYKLEPYYRDDRTDVNTAIANARELVDDIHVKAIWGTESHDFSIAMTKITNPAKVLQFTGNSSLGCCLSEELTKPGGALHYTFQTEPQEFQRSGSTAKGVLTLLEPLLGYKPKTSLCSSRTTREGSTFRPTMKLARSVGINTNMHKVGAFMLSGLFAGVGGDLQAYNFRHISPDLYGGATSLYFALMVMLGGPRTIFGPLTGAIIVTFLPEVMRIDPVDSRIAYGLALIAVIMLLPGGIIAVVERGYRSLHAAMSGARLRNKQR